MRYRKTLGTALLLFGLFSLGYAWQSSRKDMERARERAGASTAWEQSQPPLVAVLYLHGNAKCITCKDILELTEKTLGDSFSPWIEEGSLIYREINVDLPENAAYADRFAYFTTSVILALYRDGTLQSWRNLDKVWDFAERPEEFTPYFTGELRTMLKEGGLAP